jgi:hypothetical protein
MVEAFFSGSRDCSGRWFMGRGLMVKEIELKIWVYNLMLGLGGGVGSLCGEGLTSGVVVVCVIMGLGLKGRSTKQNLLDKGGVLNEHLSLASSHY